MKQTYPLFEKVKSDHAVNAYISQQNESMVALHYTEHSYAHESTDRRHVPRIYKGNGCSFEKNRAYHCSGYYCGL